jgi:VIT1/CCC1 family predicted Fe2+/Mn2+ transporter
MPESTTRREIHYSGRTGWLRAAVLGADDGIVSTASLMVGVASSSVSLKTVLIAGVAGMFAGAMSMAAGEYVSVASQRDAERSDIAQEEEELRRDPEGERRELELIYRTRGLSPQLAAAVATELSVENPLPIHVRDELGIDGNRLARPVQAAVVSAISFALGAALPLTAAIIVTGSIIAWIALATLLSLTFLGSLGARLGGASMWRGALRVVVWGAAAMVVTALMGRAIGAIGL